MLGCAATAQSSGLVLMYQLCKVEVEIVARRHGAHKCTFAGDLKN